MNFSSRDSSERIPSGKIPYTLQNDLMFHKVMHHSEKALTFLISAVKGIPMETIRSVKLLNPVDYDVFDSKELILDVLVELNNLELLDIELQIYTDTDWIMRSLLYLGRTFDSIGFGDAYNLLKPTTLVCIMGYTLFPDTAEFYACYELRNKRNGLPYTSNFQLNVLDLTQVELATQDDISHGLKDWADLFNAETWEELYTLTRKNDVFKEVYEIMRALNTIPQEKTLFEARRRWLEVHNSVISNLEKAQAERDAANAERDAALSSLHAEQQKVAELEATKAELEARIRELTAAAGSDS